MTKKLAKRETGNGHEERKDIHLVVTQESLKVARIKCAMVEMDLSRATELLWSAWYEGKFDGILKKTNGR